MTQTQTTTHQKDQFTTIKIDVEQVIANDGKPAVLVTTSETYQHPGGNASPSTKGTGRNLLRFPSEKPVELMGRPLVGQWNDKVLARNPNGNFQPNQDATTYQDYDAWSEAFHKVYSES